MRGWERLKSIPVPFRQSGASREEARESWGFWQLEFRGERLAQGLIGGGLETGCEGSALVRAQSGKTDRIPAHHAAFVSEHRAHSPSSSTMG